MNIGTFGRSSAILGALIAMLFALALGISAPNMAYADVGDVFSASSGSIDGVAVDSGTEISYAVLADSVDGAPGSVQVGDGANAAASVEYAGSIVIPESVSNGDTEYSVTSIGKNAFRGSSLTSASFPKTMERIGVNAFYGCYDLACITFAQDSCLTVIAEKAFYLPNAEKGLSSLELPASLTYIGESAFYGQASIKELAFAQPSMTKLGNYVFALCTSLERVELPAITAETSGLGCRLFYRDTALKTAVFTGDIASADDSRDGTRTFEGCTSLTDVVYYGKKFLPYWAFTGPTKEYHYDDFGTDVNPTLYYTVSYYASQDDALNRSNALGYACIRSDTAVCDIVCGMSESDESGRVVYDGAPVAYPEGYTGWAYLCMTDGSSPVLSDELPDSLSAFPVDKCNFAYASAQLASSSYGYTGAEVAPVPTVIDASGFALVAGQDYSCTYLRQNDAGDYVQTDDLVSVGSLRIVIYPQSPYTGEPLMVDYSIEYSVAGATFVDKNGFTYQIVTPCEAGLPGTATLGDGSGLAIAQETEGFVEIPSSTSPADAPDLRYEVVGIADCALGGRASGSACASITGVQIPDGVETIGAYAFGYCESLKSVTIPATVKTLGTRAFQNCNALGEVTFAGLSIEKIGAYCFAQCSALTQVSLPSFTGAACLANHAFCNCTKLNRVDFLGTVPAPDVKVFDGCVRLTRVVCYEQVWSGEFDASLDAPTIYVALTFFPNEASSKNSTGSLGTACVARGTKVAALPTQTAFEGSVPSLPAHAGMWCLASKGQAVDLPEHVYAIGVPVGESVKAGKGATYATYRVSDNAAYTAIYEKAPNRKTVEVPASVTINGVSYKVVSVAAKAFSSAKKCKRAVIGTQVTSIGKRAFAGAKKLKTLTVASKNLKKAGVKKCLAGSKVIKVKAPSGKKKAYKKIFKKKICGKAVKVV